MILSVLLLLCLLRTYENATSGIETYRVGPQQPAHKCPRTLSDYNVSLRDENQSRAHYTIKASG